MEALAVSPFNVAVLANIAQCYLRLDQLDDCVEFCTRTLYVDEKHVKALSRRATAWHRQKKLKEAADDMQKAFELDGGNADIVEQHSVIVGDYEDSLTNSELEAVLTNKLKLSKKEISSESLSASPSSVEELRFALELLKKVDEQDSLQTEGVIQDAWVAYDLLLPFMERNEYVRAKFRTSGEMDKLCGRLLTALNCLECNIEVCDSRQQTQDVITSAMIHCAAAAVSDTPRNQVVMFRHVEFRKRVLSSFEAFNKASSFSEKRVSWVVQASITHFLEQAIESKSWRNAVISAKGLIGSLLGALSIYCDEKTVQADEKSAKASIVLSVSSVCFTLSSDSAGTHSFSAHGSDCLSAVARALEKRAAMSTAALRNILGLVTNLSTNDTFRKTVESNNCEETRHKLVQALLGVVQENYRENLTALTTPRDYACVERALGALLNLSFTETSLVRAHDLVEFKTVDILESVFTQTNQSTFPKAILVLARSASLLCRLHSSCRDNAAKGELFDKLTSSDILSKLYNVCEYANASFSGKKEGVPNEIWQRCAQIWCHMGWCSQLNHVRAFLRENNAVPLLTQVIALSNAQKAYKRPTDETTACERLVGNIVKVLIAMQSDHNLADIQAFRKQDALAVFVNALQGLSDGLARKNVAILLAKLCQADSQVKDTVRELRGIEMMLSVSQSLRNRAGVLSRK
ncbi:unnamed protein product [Phytophthora lilii]|uniref:Unnamed protein product n=1 Tax=Phytophthora lilii TaxID=2077276 RepID=A0A9W6U7V3_9STRA|nr:unnamed protein product [Phytophthora lilii]